MAELVWRSITEQVNNRTITGEYAKDGAYIRVKNAGVEDQMEHKKQRAEGVARRLLRQMAELGKI